MTLPAEELVPEAPRGELVHWMEPGPVRLEPPALALTAAAAFAVGVATAFAALATWRWIEPRREGLPPWKWRRGPVH